MKPVARKRRSPAAIRPSGGFWDRLVDRWRRWRDEARQHAELAALDGATLRDLGLQRGEFGSLDAESRGLAACTRRRLVGCRVDATQAG